MTWDAKTTVNTTTTMNTTITVDAMMTGDEWDVYGRWRIGATGGQQASQTMKITHIQEGPNEGLGTVGEATPSGLCHSA
jgi:hypothetical protein